MEIELKEITVRELTEDYEDHEELGVRASGGDLDVRPPYQREFVDKDEIVEHIAAVRAATVALRRRVIAHVRDRGRLTGKLPVSWLLWSCGRMCGRRSTGVSLRRGRELSCRAAGSAV